MAPGEFQPLTEGDSSISFEEDIEEGLRDGEGVQSPRVVLPRNKQKNTCVCLVIFVLIIATIFAWYLLYNNWDGEDTGQHSHLEARVGGSWPHTYNSRRSHTYPHCGEDGIECCYIYGQYHDYNIDPKRVIKRDESGSNCPSLSTIVHEYNEYYRKNTGDVNCSTTECCSVDISRDELIRHNVTVEVGTILLPVSKETHDVCPRITTMIVAYEDYYHEGGISSFLLFIFLLFGFLITLG